ncbi:MAG: ABC transporter permease subunit [Clostridiales bacterium]|nr:ABC transporter permease subunit [Clostridiales bacterium]
MGSLLKWEMKQTLSSKSFWILGASLVALPALMLLMAISFGADYTGYEAFLSGLNDYNAFVMFLIGVFAGIHVTGAFEGRKIQSAVMAGNSRFSILLAKFMSFSIAVTLYSIAAILVSTAIAFGTYGVTGLDGSFGRVILVRTLVFIFVEIAYSATCFLASMLVRHLGGAIGLNLGLMIMTNLAAQIFLNFEWAEKFIRLTPVGQTMFIVADCSNTNIAMALAASAVAIAAVIALSYLKFRREELK